MGLAMGIAGHGIATATALQISEEAGAFAGLGMCLNGVLTACFVPLHGKRHGGISRSRWQRLDRYHQKNHQLAPAAHRQSRYLAEQKNRKASYSGEFPDFTGICRNTSWCREPDSNRQAVRRRILSPLCLPISSSRQGPRSRAVANSTIARRAHPTAASRALRTGGNRTATPRSHRRGCIETEVIGSQQRPG